MHRFANMVHIQFSQHHFLPLNDTVNYAVYVRYSQFTGAVWHPKLWKTDRFNALSELTLSMTSRVLIKSPLLHGFSGMTSDATWYEASGTVSGCFAKFRKIGFMVYGENLKCDSDVWHVEQSSFPFRVKVQLLPLRVKCSVHIGLAVFSPESMAFHSVGRLQ